MLSNNAGIRNFATFKASIAQRWGEQVEEESYPAAAEGLAGFVCDPLEPASWQMVKEAQFTPAI